MNNQYVILTGSKNNAGDYLIKYRAKQLFASLRPDRKIIDYDGWKVLNKEQLVVVNASKALILMGGPALHPDMYPNVYPLTKDLSEIKVPIVTMGIGWKSREGSWEASNNYKLTPATLQLLKKVDGSGFTSSVRDYHTLNMLHNYKFENFIMTGCPAFYSTDHINEKYATTEEVKNISFSLGVSFIENASMEKQMKDIILMLKEFFSGKSLTVVFHHSLRTNHYANDLFHKRHLDFKNWCDQNLLGVKDISGSEENLINHYSECDLHIGYRVHAHLFMCSISKPSVLIHEDGRGKGFTNVISGLALDGYHMENEGAKLPVNKDLRTRIANKLYSIMGNMKSEVKMKAYESVTSNLNTHLKYELENGLPRIKLTRINIDSHYEQMKKFLVQLP